MGTICVHHAGGVRMRPQDALYVPGMAATLVFLACLFATNNYTLVFGAQVPILNCQHRVVALASCQTNGLYKLDGGIIMCTPSPPHGFVAMHQGPLLTTCH